MSQKRYGGSCNQVLYPVSTDDLYDYFHHHHVAWLINCWCLPVRSFFLVWKVRYIIVFEVQDVYPILFDVHQPSPKSGPIQ